MGRTGLGIGQTAVAHAHQRAILPLDQVDLDEAGAWRYLLASLPAEAVGEAMHRDNLGEPALSDVVAGDIDQIETIETRLHRRLRAHPAQNLFRIGEEGEDGRGRCRDLNLPPEG